MKTTHTNMPTNVLTIMGSDMSVRPKDGHGDEDCGGFLANQMLDGDGDALLAAEPAQPEIANAMSRFARFMPATIASTTPQERRNVSRLSTTIRPKMAHNETVAI